MSRLLQKLNQIFLCYKDWVLTPIQPSQIILFRRFMGILCLLNLAFLWPDMDMWFSNHGVFPNSIQQLYDNQSTRISLYMFTGSTDLMIPAIEILSILGGLSLIFGVFPQAGAFFSWLALSSIAWRNMNILHSGDTLLRIACFFLIFVKPQKLRAPWDHRTSPAQESLIPAWPQRCLQLQLCLVYLVTGTWKTIGGPWQAGTAVADVLQLGEFERFPIPDFMMTPWASQMMTVHTLIVEMGFPFLIWIPRIRPYVLIGGLSLHLGLEWTLNVQLFQWIILSFYALFIDLQTIKTLKNDFSTLKNIIAKYLQLSLTP